MQSLEQPFEQSEQCFRRSRSASVLAVVLLVGGVLGVMAALAGFALALVIRADRFTLQLMTTMPMLAGLGALAAAASMARAPSEVAVGPEGVRIVERGGSRVYAWEVIAWANIETAPLSNRRRLTLFDTEGKTLVRLDESLEGFDTLAEGVRGRIAARNDDTTERVRMLKARRSAVFLVLGGLLALALAGVNAYFAAQEQRAAALFKTAAVPGVGQIERRFLAPNGVTCRLEYRVTSPDGRSATRNAEVERGYWDALEGAKTVPVRYVPGDPAISRLARGEVEERDLSDQPEVMFGLSAILALMGLFFMGVGVLSWRGWDVDLDSKTGRISIKRFGTGR